MENREIAKQVYPDVEGYLDQVEHDRIQFIRGLEYSNKQLIDEIDDLKSSLEINEKLRKEDTDDFVKALNESDDKSKKLLEEIDDLKSKVSNWMDKYTEINKENKKLQSELKDKEMVNEALSKSHDELLKIAKHYIKNHDYIVIANADKLTRNNK